MDLVEANYVPVDFKSAAAKPDKENAAFDHEIQLVSYQQQQPIEPIPPMNMLNPTTHTKKHHRLDPAEIVALAALSAVGAVLRNPRLANLAIPPAMRADVTFEGCAGSGQITGTEIFGPYDKPLEFHEAERLLEISLPAANGTKMPIGKLLNGAIISLLEVSHPGWADDEGCGRMPVETVYQPEPASGFPERPAIQGHITTVPKETLQALQTVAGASTDEQTAQSTAPPIAA